MLTASEDAGLLSADIRGGAMELGLGVVSYFLNEATPYAIFAGGGYLAWRFVRAYERRAAAPDQLNALADRVRILEDVMDQVEDRIDRADEVQRFTTRVLAGHVANNSR